MNEEWIWEKIFRMNDLVDGVAINDELKFVDIDKKDFEKYRVKKNDILFNRVNSIDFVGRTGIFKSTKEDSVFASYLVRVNVDESRIKPDYLNLFLNSKFWKKEILRKARRAVNQANVNAEELKRINLPILPYPFQEKLETLSEESFKYLELSKSLYSEAEQILLRELDLIDWQPSEENITEKMSEEVELFGRCDAEFFQPKYDEFFEKLKKFETKKLWEIVDYQKWVEPGADAYSESWIPFIRVADVSVQWIDTIEKNISPELYEEYWEKYSPKKDEILFTKDGTIGISFVINEDMKAVLSGAFLRFQKKIGIESEYLALVLNSIVCKLQIERFSGGAIIAHLKPSDAMEMIIPIFSDSIQSLISEKIIASHLARETSKKLLEKAKRAVEIFIEEDEENGSRYLES